MNSFIERIKENVPPVTLNLVIISGIVLLAQHVLPGVLNVDITNLLGLHYWQASTFHFWQPLTYMFLHATNSLAHILFNMFALVMFGAYIERVWGGKRFLIFYIVCGLSAALLQQLVWFIDLSTIANNYSGVNVEGTIFSVGEYASFLNTIGASGAVYGILLAFGMLFPNAPIYFFFIPIAIKAKYAVIIYGVLELVLGLTGSDNVAHFAHLGGMIGGLILILIWRKKRIIGGPLF